MTTNTTVRPTRTGRRLLVLAALGLALAGLTTLQADEAAGVIRLSDIIITGQAADSAGQTAAPASPPVEAAVQKVREAAAVAAAPVTPAVSDPWIDSVPVDQISLN